MKIVDDKLLAKIHFTPHKGQLKMIKSRTREFVAICGRRWGKTNVCAYLALRRILVPNSKVWVVAPCVDTKTEILSKRGWLTYDKLRIGDIVLTIDKEGNAEWKKCQKIHKFEHDGEMLRMKSRGHDSLTTLHHRWLVGYSRGDRKKISGYRFTNSANLNKSNEFIPCAAKVINLPSVKKYSDSLVELVAWYYTEGSDNGNGINISQNRGEKADRIRNALLKEFGEPQERGCRTRPTKPSWTDWRKQNKDELNDNGVFYLNSKAASILRELAPDKVVSDKFLNSLTQEQLNLFIEVSLLADGHIRRNGTDRIFIQSRKDRIDALQKAVQLSGQQSCLKYSKSKQIWNLHIFTRNKVWIGQKCYAKNKKIVKYRGTVWCPQTENKTWLARRNGTVYFTGNSYDLTKKVFEYVIKYISILDADFEAFKVGMRPFPRIHCSNGSFLEGKSTENPKSLLGEELDLIIHDEAAQTPEEIYYQYIVPTTSSRLGRIVHISTPRGNNWLQKRFVSVGKDNRIQEPSMAGLVAALGKKQAKKEWDRLKSSYPRDLFNQEFMAQFVEGASNVFRAKDIDAITNEKCLKDYQPGHFYVLGVDLAKMNDYTVLTVIDLYTNSVVYWERINKDSYVYQKDRILAIAHRYNRARIILDSTGVGEPVFDDLLASGMMVDDFRFSNASKERLIDKLRIYIEEGNIVIPNEPILIEELKNYSKDMTPSGRITYSAPIGQHDDAVTSLALAVWGIIGKVEPKTAIQEELQKIQKLKVKRRNII